MKKNLVVLGFLTLGLLSMAQTPRLVLVEEFTGETCPPCAAYNPAFNTLLTQHAGTVTAIKWQVPIPNAPSATWSLFQTNKSEITWRYSSYGYGINSAPSARIDGQNPTVFGASDDNITAQNTTVFNAAHNLPSAFSISMNRAWNKTCTAVTLTISITATLPFTAVGSLIFRTVMVEEKIHFNTPPGSNGEKDFEDVAIKSFPTLQGGVPMAKTWTVGQTQTFTLSCAVPSYTRKKDEIAFVGLIQDDGNRKVAQAARIGKQTVPPESMSAITAEVDLTCNSMISPTVQIKNEQSVNAVTAFTIIPYVDGVAGAGIPWSGNLAAGATTVIALNNVSSPAISGSHSFSVDIDMPVTPFNLITNGTKLNYMSGINYQSTPVTEGFTANAYPPAGFGAINKNAGPGWSRSTAAGAYNVQPLESTKYDFFNNTQVGDKDELYLPPMDLSSAPHPILTFDQAYARRNDNSEDALDVMVSDNCGANWTNVYNAHGASLATAPNNAVAYVPDMFSTTDWRTITVDLSNYKQPDLLVKFVTTSDNGNNLYLDNINLRLVDETGIEDNSTQGINVSLYPNPTRGRTYLSVTSVNAGQAKISVTNTLGQKVYEKDVTLNTGTSNIELDLKEQAAGIYYVSIDTNGSTLVKKLSVNKN